jgi:hypothetical protein
MSIRATRSRFSSAILPLFRDCSESGQNAFLVNQVLRAWDSNFRPPVGTHGPRHFFRGPTYAKSPKHETGNHDDQHGR